MIRRHWYRTTAGVLAALGLATTLWAADDSKVPEKFRAAIKAKAEQPKQAPPAKAEAPKQAPQARPEPRREAPQARPEPRREAPQARPEPKREAPQARPEPKREAPQARPEPRREAPQARPEVPQVRPEVPRARPETPAVRPEVPRVRPDAPQARPETPRVRPDVPAVRPEVPRIRPEAPVARPEVPAVRPEVPRIRPETPVARPEVPAVRPGNGPTERPDRPIIGEGRPGNRPDNDNRPGNDRPIIGEGRPGNRPDNDNRPGNDRPGDNRPGNDRPTIGDGRPGNRPDNDNRPGNDRPGDNRPGNDRPTIGGNRPGDGRPGDGRPGDGRPGNDRPTIGDGRPGDGRPGNDRPSRPVIGDGRPGNRPDFVGRPGDGRPGDGRPGDGRPGDGRPGDGRPGDGRPGDGRPGGISGLIPGWGRPEYRPEHRHDDRDGNRYDRRPGSSPNWGYNPQWANYHGYDRRPSHERHDHWSDYWRSSYVRNQHQNWYRGSWGRNSNTAWYVPLVYGAAGWGFSSWSMNSGYYAYRNPYYTPSTTVVYNYSRPVQVVQYTTYDTSGAEVAYQPTQADLAAARLTEQARASFKLQEYPQALRYLDQAVALTPNDPVVHELRGLTLFSMQRYEESAAVLNALLAVAPGWDWATMSGLYDNVETYTRQSRALEAHRRANPEDPAARFVLAYHYLVQGHADASRKELEKLVTLQPQDRVAARMLAGLQPVDAAALAAGPQFPEETVTVARPIEPGQPAPAPAATDPIGVWVAERDGTTIGLRLNEDGAFSWQARPPKGYDPLPELNGKFSLDDNMLMLDGGKGDENSLVGKVTSVGPDEFRFILLGAPTGDTGLSFRRVR